MREPDPLQAPHPAERPSPVALVPASKVIRRLEGTERMVAMANADYRGNFNVVAMIELHGPVTAPLLQRALEKVQRAHEILRVEVVRAPGSANDWAFHRSDEVAQLEELEGDWRTHWDRANHSVLTGLGWRLMWVRGGVDGVSQLVVTFNHALLDGGSVLVFFDELLSAMHLDAAHRAAAPKPIAGTAHRLVKARWPLGAMARIAWYRYLRPLASVPFDSEQKVPVTQRRWSGSFRTLEQPVVEQLLAQCRNEKVTLGTALSAATLLELAGRVRERKPGRAFDLVLCTSIDLRKFAEPPVEPTRLGLLVSVLHSFFRPTPAHTPWSLAREVAVELKRAIDDNEHRDLSMLPALIGPTAAARFVEENHGRPKEASLLVSNLGKPDGLAHGPFRAAKFFITGSQVCWGSTLVLCISTIGGRMCIHLGHPEPVLTQASGEALLDGLLARVGVAGAR